MPGPVVNIKERIETQKPSATRILTYVSPHIVLREGRITADSYIVGRKTVLSLLQNPGSAAGNCQKAECEDGKEAFQNTQIYENMRIFAQMEKISNNELKQIRSLREKKYRDSLGLFVVEGEKMVEEARASGFGIVRTIRREDVGDAVMERLSSMSSPSPVLAVVRKGEAASHPASGLCLGLDSVRDPGNMGTILRIADWFGIDCIFASRDCVEIYNPKVVQASMGAIFRKKVVYCDLPAKCREFADAGLQVFGTFLHGDIVYKCDLPSEGLVVMGNEANGISGAVAAECGRRITIPTFGGGSESLNVSIATAVIVSEFRRWK